MKENSTLSTVESNAIGYDISVSVKTEYIAAQLIENEKNYVFSYTISITNNSNKSVKLLSRYWLITDGDNNTSTVAGEGVIGKQPIIAPENTYTYTSGCILKTPVGTMQGHYQMLSDDRDLQQVEIPVFGLAQPNILN
ncbi:Co2+/Mg2+ efflux protein ApaG [Colwellia hornerae]|uniref:Protein ApaG n=1 Tax=Colwellia hornerae TaxID=89402 RepID=A0A5C6QAU8_9GAMM|nr:Co2+/Mg2+ efflux protein ApaG [Colwellia hornerae]TWX53026.1 Co2+/Mg2+ efflux protein ApaG [Colwellia hornerae]TWX59289.1 Co2+/Mg2+ efflux protein ApaG [Colwellia hornerae]TWX66175.1 Co2+/Mg2+ efflux protein ApaG [Colwellia hornerae]